MSIATCVKKFEWKKSGKRLWKTRNLEQKTYLKKKIVVTKELNCSKLLDKVHLIKLRSIYYAVEVVNSTS